VALLYLPKEIFVTKLEADLVIRYQVMTLLSKCFTF